MVGTGRTRSWGNQTAGVSGGMSCEQSKNIMAVMLQLCLLLLQTNLHENQVLSPSALQNGSRDVMERFLAAGVPYDLVGPRHYIG